MTNEQARRAEEIFLAVVDLEEPARTELLRRECGNDEVLRRAVLELLRHDALAPGDFLVGAPLAPEQPMLPPPVRIGQYRIVERIGEGGMGTVFAAEQEMPRRKVAVKVIRPGLVSPDLLRRFRAEVMALGVLHHPGIAQVFDAGTADASPESGFAAGQPYVVLELVDGLRLDAHANRHRLDVRERLELVARACDAVQHAHQRGVIHRDLKPANILVARLEPAGDGPAAVRTARIGQPKVLDFGVARLTGELARSLETTVGQVVGTLDYMAPEQVGGGGGTDTRSDVYSLGTILYELLSGAPPLDCRACTLPEALRRVQELEPRPLGDADPALRGEIEVIVAKAMAKDPERRYQSAAELAADLRRHLRGEPIEARADSALYVLGKTLRRHRVPVALVAISAALLLALTVVSLVQARANRNLSAREREARRRVERQLVESDIQRGRLYGWTGNVAGAEELLWRAWFAGENDEHARWALRELYARVPCLATVRSDGAARAAAWVDGGRHVITTGEDGRVVLRDGATLEPLASGRASETAILAACASRDGSTVATADRDGNVRIWDVAGLSDGGAAGRPGAETGGGRLVARVPDLPWSLRFDAEGRRLFVASADGSVVVVDPRDGASRGEIAPVKDGAFSLELSPDGAMLAAGGGDGALRLLDAATLRVLRSIAAHASGIYSIAFSSDGRVVATGSDDRTVHAWDVASGRRLATLQSPNGTIRGLAFSPDGATLASTGWWAVDLWDVATWQRRASLPLGGWHSAWSPDGRRLACARDAGEIRLWQPPPGDGIVRYSAGTGRMVAIVTPDGRHVVTGDGAGVVRWHDAETGALIASLAASPRRVKALAMTGDGRLFATASEDGVVAAWDARTRARLLVVEAQTVSGSEAIAFSPDGTRLATAQPDGTVALRDVQTGAIAATIPGAHEHVATCWSGESRILVLTARSRDVRFLSADLEPLFTITTAPAPWNVAISADGLTAAIGTWTGHVLVVQLAGGRIERELEGHRAVVYGVAFHPRDPFLLASASGDGTVRLWDVRDGACLATLSELGGWDAITVAFSTDGSRLVVAGANGQVVSWDLGRWDAPLRGNAQFQRERLQASRPPEP